MCDVFKIAHRRFAPMGSVKNDYSAGSAIDLDASRTVWGIG